MFLKLSDGQNLSNNSFGIGKLVLLDMRRVNGGRIDGADPFDRGIKIIEGVFLNESCDLRRNSTKWLRFVDEDCSISLFYGLNNCVLVEWADGAEVNHFSVNIMLSLIHI